MKNEGGVHTYFVDRSPGTCMNDDPKIWWKGLKDLAPHQKIGHQEVIAWENDDDPR